VNAWFYCDDLTLCVCFFLMLCFRMAYAGFMCMRMCLRMSFNFKTYYMAWQIFLCVRTFITYNHI